MAVKLLKNLERIPQSSGFSNHHMASAIVLQKSFFLTANTGYNNKVNSENIYNEATSPGGRKPSRKAPGKVYK